MRGKPSFLELGAAALLMVFGTLLAAPPLAAQQQALILTPVPEPDLEALEKPVAEQLRAAQERLETALEEPVQAELAQAYGDLALLYHAYDLDEPAQAAYRNAARLAPGDPRWHHGLGLQLRDEGELEKARASFERVLELAPETLSTRIYLGEIHLEAGRPEEARAEFEKALEIAPTDASARAALGQLALSEKDYAKAVEQFELALALAPDADQLHYPLALAYRGLGNVEKAREHAAVQGQVGVKPGDPVLAAMEQLERGSVSHILRGRRAFRAGRHEEAAQAFRQALEANPESVPARVNLATALVPLGYPERAMELNQEAVELDPGNAAAHYNLGVLYANQADYEEAIGHFRATLEANAEDVAARVALARALRATGDDLAALAELEHAVATDPATEAARFEEAAVLVQLGRYAEAVERLEAALEVMPNEGRLIHALARLLAGSPDPELRDGPRAVELASQVVQVAPSPGHALTLAMALAQDGRCEEAAAMQRQVIEVFEKNGETERVAELQAGLGRYEAGPPCQPPAS